jgi:hypothetical protein
MTGMDGTQMGPVGLTLLAVLVAVPFAVPAWLMAKDGRTLGGAIVALTINPGWWLFVFMWGAVIVRTWR